MTVAVGGHMRCTKCGCVDLMIKAYPDGLCPGTQELTCTSCQGRKWHNLFLRKKYDPEKDQVCNPPIQSTPIMVME